MDDVEEILWESVLSLNGKTLKPLANRKKGQDFRIIETFDDYIKIRFLESTGEMELKKKRFLLAYNYLKKNMGRWVKIGASKIDTNPDSIEGVIKLGTDGKLNGLSTATWLAAILVECEPKISFNGKLKNQALVYK